MELENKVHIGVDPGKTGAITYLYPDRSIDSICFPKIGNEYDITEMANIFKAMKMINCHIAIEDVKALQKPYQSGNWSLSAGKHILMTLCHVYELPYTLVHSKTWQKEMLQGVPLVKDKKGDKDNKAMATIAAKRLFPGVELRDPNRKTDRGTKAHDGVVDSLLIAGYCKRRF